METIEPGLFVAYPRIYSYEIFIYYRKIFQCISTKIYYVSEKTYLDYKGIYKY